MVELCVCLSYYLLIFQDEDAKIYCPFLIVFRKVVMSQCHLSGKGTPLALLLKLKLKLKDYGSSDAEGAVIYFQIKMVWDFQVGPIVCGFPMCLLPLSLVAVADMGNAVGWTTPAHFVDCLYCIVHEKNKLSGSICFQTIKILHSSSKGGHFVVNNNTSFPASCVESRKSVVWLEILCPCPLNPMSKSIHVQSFQSPLHISTDK